MRSLTKGFLIYLAIQLRIEPLTYREYLDEHRDVTFALVDHITSPAAVVMPVREIVRVCRERGVKVMVDAAHSPGQLPLDVKVIGAQFLTGW